MTSDTTFHPPLCFVREGLGKAVLTAVAVALIPAAAIAAPPANPTSIGQVERQIEKNNPDLERQQPPASTFESELEAVPEADTDGPQLKVSTVSVLGNTVFDEDTLIQASGLLPDTKASVADLKAATTRITNYYRERGYMIARAYLPKQDASDGNLTIGVLEGVLEAVDVDNDSRLSNQRIARTITAQATLGEPFQAEPVNRGVLLLNQLPGSDGVQASLSAGEAQGSTKLNLDVAKAPLINGVVAVNNYGNTYTGETGSNLALRVNNPLGLGDRLSLSGSLTEHAWTNSGRVDWNVPVGYDGWRVGVSYARTNYELGNQFSLLEAHGTADTVSAYAKYPLILTPSNQTDLSLSLKHKSLTDYMLGTKVSDNRVNAITAAVQGQLTDAALGTRAITSWRLSATYGDLSLDDQSAYYDSLSGADTRGRYGLAGFRLSRQQLLPAPGLSLYTALRGQVAAQNLDSSESFSLGGPNGIRGYPSGEAVGDEGWLATLGLRHRPLDWLTLRLFQDAGEVRFNHDPYPAGLTQSGNSRYLASTGIGVDARWSDLTLSTDVAWRNKDSAVGDTDRNPRVWAQASWSF